MARPKGSTKPAEEKGEMHSFRFPHKLWKRFIRLVPAKRSKFLFQALSRSLDELGPPLDDEL